MLDPKSGASTRELYLYCRQDHGDVMENTDDGEEYDDSSSVGYLRKRRRRRNAQHLNVTTEDIIRDRDLRLFNVSEEDNDTSTVPPAEYEKIMKTVVYGSMQANISGLDHFQDYIIEVLCCTCQRLCREKTNIVSEQW